MGEVLGLTVGSTDDGRGPGLVKIVDAVLETYRRDFHGRRYSGRKLRRGGRATGPSLYQDRGMTAPANEQATRRPRRPEWRGDRKAVLIRVPSAIALELQEAAAQRRCSVSEHAGRLLTEALRRGDL